MKKIIVGLMLLLIIISVIFVYFIPGMIGVYFWNVVIFIISPIALLASILQIIILIVKVFKRKIVKWNIIFLFVTLIFAYPITILFGISNITYPAKENESKGIYITMPVENAIIFGGKEYKTHAIWPSERYAYDILSSPYNTGDKYLENYGIYNADVISPTTGIVIDIENEEIDIPPNIEEFTSSLGNYIFIKVKETDTYLILAHLKQGSIIINMGDEVKEGQLIAKVGNSGTTSEPHLHVQHQENNPLDTVFPTCAQGLPIFFKDN